MAKSRGPFGYGPRDWSPRPGHPLLGKRVKLKREVDRYPDFVAPEGMTGVIVMMENDFIRVQMDQPVYGAEPWDNEVHWQWEDVSNFEDDVEILGGRS